MKIAAVGDIHTRIDNKEDTALLLRNAATGSDILVLCGDLTQEGLPEEGRVLREILDAVAIPVVAVLGNHDYESGQPDAVAGLLKSPRIHILQGDHIVIGGIGFAGVKGFAGGFDGHMLPKFGEPLLKQVVDEGTRQALLLEKALSQLDTNIKVVISHYSPIRQTVVGEPEEIFPFLGLTRMEGPINRFGVTLAFHGHAHNGSYEGRTSAGIRVFNVTYPLLARRNLPASVHEIAAE